MRAVEDAAAKGREGEGEDEGDVDAEDAPDDVFGVGKLASSPYGKREDVSAEHEEEDDGFATGDEGPEDPGWGMKLADGPPVMTDDGDGGDSADCVELCDSTGGLRLSGGRSFCGRSHAITILISDDQL